MLENILPRFRYLIRRIYLKLGLGKVRKPSYSKRRIVGEGNIFNATGSTVSLVALDIHGNNNKIEVGKDSTLNKVVIYIRGSNNKITIGEKCRFIDGSTLWIENDDCHLNIGSMSSFVNAHLAVTESGSRMDIGEDCMFAYDIDVRTGDSHSIVDNKTGSRINPARDVSIGNHVWVAAHVNILKGVHIKDNSIIGTGSVVVKGSDEENVIYAGNPASVVKKNISWSRDRL